MWHFTYALEMVWKWTLLKVLLFKKKLDLIQDYPLLPAPCPICLLMGIVERERIWWYSNETRGKQSTNLAMLKETVGHVNSVTWVLAEKKDIEPSKSSPIRGNIHWGQMTEFLYWICPLLLCDLISHLCADWFSRWQNRVAKELISWYMLDGNNAWEMVSTFSKCQ